MRRMICVLAVTALAAGPASAGILGLPNEVRNGGFESGYSGNWVVTPTGSITRLQYNHVNSANPVEAPPWGGGNRCGGTHTSWGGNWSAPMGTIRQVIDESTFPGWDPLGTQKEIALQFDYALVARHSEPGRSTEIRIYLDYMLDGSYPYPGDPGHVRQQVFSAVQPANDHAAWVYPSDWRHQVVQLTLPVQPQYLGVTVEFYARYAEWSFVYVDNIDLEARCIPEPATMGLLMLGLPLVRRRR